MERDVPVWVYGGGVVRAIMTREMMEDFLPLAAALVPMGVPAHNPGGEGGYLLPPDLARTLQKWIAREKVRFLICKRWERTNARRAKYRRGVI